MLLFLSDFRKKFFPLRADFFGREFFGDLRERVFREAFPQRVVGHEARERFRVGVQVERGNEAAVFAVGYDVARGGEGLERNGNAAERRAASTSTFGKPS